MSPVLPREERDAIRARAEKAAPGPWEFQPDASTDDDYTPNRVWTEIVTGYWQPEASDYVLAHNIANEDAEFIAHARTDVPALLDALDAAEEEIGRLRGLVPAIREGYDASESMRVTAEAERDEARAALAALLERIEGLHRPDGHGPGRCDKAGCITSCVECGDDWPCATVRALAAAPSETEEGR